MIIKRSSTHILKFSNKNKIEQLEQVFEDYKTDLIFYIEQILKQKPDLNSAKFFESVSSNIIIHSRWKQIIHKQASEIIRSNIRYARNKRYSRYKKCYKYFAKNNRQLKFLSKRFSELRLNHIFSRIRINIKNICINMDYRIISYDKSSSHFDEFIGIKLPYLKSKRRAFKINLPIKQHKQSLKYKNWNRKNTILLRKIHGNFYITFIYEKEIMLKQQQAAVAFDIGYDKLLVSSNNDVYGVEMKQLYTKLSNMKRGSINYKQYLIFKDNKINEICNKIDFYNNSIVVLEDLKNVKHKSKYSKKMNNKMQYWSYTKTISKLQSMCEEQGIELKKVSSFYTSQECSSCGFKHKENRKLDKFLCLECGLSLDADYNAALNILHRGVYNPSDKESSCK